MIQSYKVVRSPAHRYRHKRVVWGLWQFVVIAFISTPNDHTWANASKDRPTDNRLDIRLRIDAGFAHYRADKLTLTSGSELRRLRATSRWQFADGWRVYLETDLRRGNPKIQRMWLQYRPRPYWKINAGMISVPFGLDWQTSSNNGAFAERSLTSALTEQYQTGISTSLGSQKSSIRIGAFTNTPVDSAGDQTYGWSVAGTATSMLWGGATAQVHGLVSLQYRQPDEALRFRARPETHISGQRLVDTRSIKDVDSVWRSGAGLIYTHGPKSLVAEYIHTRLARGSKDNAAFAGWYVQGRWLLSGEERRFSERRGAFTRINPRRRTGAWELSVRMSHLDLDDGAIKGGRETNYTLGLNWYFSRNIRVLANYTLARALPNRKRVADKPEIIQLLLQMNF